MRTKVILENINEESFDSIKWDGRFSCVNVLDIDTDRAGNIKYKIEIYFSFPLALCSMEEYSNLLSNDALFASIMEGQNIGVDKLKCSSSPYAQYGKKGSLCYIVAESPEEFAIEKYHRPPISLDKLCVSIRYMKQNKVFASSKKSYDGADKNTSFKLEDFFVVAWSHLKENIFLNVKDGKEVGLSSTSVAVMSKLSELKNIKEFKLKNQDLVELSKKTMEYMDEYPSNNNYTTAIKTLLALGYATADTAGFLIHCCLYYDKVHKILDVNGRFGSIGKKYVGRIRFLNTTEDVNQNTKTITENHYYLAKGKLLKLVSRRPMQLPNSENVRNALILVTEARKIPSNYHNEMLASFRVVGYNNKQGHVITNIKDLLIKEEYKDETVEEDIFQL